MVGMKERNEIVESRNVVINIVMPVFCTHPVALHLRAKIEFKISQFDSGSSFLHLNSSRQNIDFYAIVKAMSMKVFPNMLERLVLSYNFLCIIGSNRKKVTWIAEILKCIDSFQFQITQ